MSNITQLIQSSIRRDTSVQPTTYSASQMGAITRELGQATPMIRTQSKTASPYVTQLIQSSVRRIPTNAIAGIGGTTLRLPAGRSVISPASGDKTGVIPTSTLATESAFGGANGGMGAAIAPAALGPTTLSGIGSSFSKASVSIMNTFGSLIPLAIKVISAIIVIKIVLWLIRKRR